MELVREIYTIKHLNEYETEFYSIQCNSIVVFASGFSYRFQQDSETLARTGKKRERWPIRLNRMQNP